MDLRISGIASGLDTEQIIKDLMKAQRVRVDKLEQSKTTIQWRQELFNSLNKDFANFILDTKKEFGLTTTSATGSLLNKSVSSMNWVKKVVSSNPDMASVSARADSVQGSYEVKVKQLASNWSAGSEDKITQAADGSTANVAAQFNLADTDTIDFTITTNKGSVNINKTNLASVAINDIITEINGANIGVTAVYDSSIDRFFLQTKDTGTENTIQVTDSSLLSNGNTAFISGDNSTLKLKHIDDTGVSQYITAGNAYSGKNAIIDFGAAQNIEQSSNQFTINGITFDLKAKGDFTINVTTDVDAVYEKISKFVEKYNELVTKLNGELGEKRYSSYAPLTAEQKESMSEKEIELWEEKAKSGLVKGDMVLQRTLLSMRGGMYEQVEGVEGAFNQLTQIGISTEGYFSGSKGGQLTIDETKLKEAIQQDVDGVIQLLFKEPSTDLNKDDRYLTASQIQQKRKESGLIKRLYDNIIVGMKDIITKAGTGDNADLYRSVNSSILIDFVTEYGSISMLDKDISNYDKRLTSLNDYLTRAEDRYWQQFTAMEKALQQMNSQSAWMMQQFGGGQ
ncbi:MAG: flagellar filament capping protein FliD [Bacillota bacterium]